MVKQSDKERRNFVRAKRVLSVQFRIFKSPRKNLNNAWQLSMTEDMSLGGISFYSDQELKPGEIIELHVVMSGLLDIFRGYAEVVRVDKKKNAAFYFIAVKFIEVKSKSRAAKSYIGKRSNLKSKV